MTLSPYEQMQKAVDIVGTSEHPTNKIAATLAGKDAAGREFSISRTNYWPAPIKNHIGTEVRVGNSSGTVHAETACLIDAPMANDSQLFITDPPCPNCVKYMAEAGVSALYIDHKGFDKDFAKRRGEHFEAMSMRICERAGINVYRIFRKEERLERILEIRPGYSPAVENPPEVEALVQEHEELSPEKFLSYVQAKENRYKNKPFAAGIAYSLLGKPHLISAGIHPVIGYTSKTLEEPEEKYSFLLQPINRVIMTAARYGLRIEPDYLFSSRVPSSRELVNMVGSGLTKLIIGDPEQARDEFSVQALKQLQKAEILNIQQ